jgi:putative addiction module killer protein
LSLGNPGDVRPVGEGVSELRIDVGPGYRAYYLRVEQLAVLMLAGGDKSSQDRDIRRALDMARDIRAAEKAATATAKTKAKASKPRKQK